MIPQNHNDATVTPEELSEYAQLRLKRMKEIEDFMNELGLGNGPVIANLASTNQASACVASAVTKKVPDESARVKSGRAGGVRMTSESRCEEEEQ